MMEFDGLLLSMVYLMDVVEIYLVVNFVVMRYILSLKRFKQKISFYRSQIYVF